MSFGKSLVRGEWVGTDYYICSTSERWKLLGKKLSGCNECFFPLCQYFILQ